MKPKRQAKAEAARVAESLTRNSVRIAGSSPEFAKQQAALARKIMLRYNVRFGYSLKRFTCRGCKTLIVPGVNARVRLGHGKTKFLRITCMECGRVNRKILAQS